MSNVWTPTRVVTVTVSAVFDESDSLDDQELADVGTEALAAALPDGFHFNSSSAHVTSVSHAPER